MTRPAPVPEAIDRLRVYGDTEVLGFINEVKAKSTKELLRVLPSVDGFRKDSASSLPTRKRTMLGYLLKKGGGSASSKARADSTYYYFWRSWAEEHLADVEGLKEAFDAIEKVASKDGAPSEQTDAAVEQLFRLLQEQSFLNHCSAEAISRLLHFSPFAITDPLDRMASGAKPQIAVEKDRALSALPKRLSDDEERLKRLEERVAELAEEVAGIMGDLPDFGRQEPVLTVAPEALTDLGGRVDDMARHLQGLDDQLRQSGERDATGRRLDAVERGVADMETLWAETEDRGARAMEDLRRQVAELAEQAARAVPVPPTGPQLSAAAFPALQVAAPRGPVAAAKRLLSAVEASNLLTANLQALGLKPSGAPVFAQEVLAAVLTGKVLFLNGSFAPDVAQVIATSLAATHVRRARVPVGYVDASHFDDDMLDTLPAQRDAAAVLVLERINNAPLEVLADAIGELARTADTFIIGTLTEGISTLPAHPLYLQFGPVFETDALDWTLFPKAGAAMSAGALVSLDPTSLSMPRPKARPSSEEPLRLLRKVRVASNRRLERSVLAYMATLEAFRSANIPTSLQSIAYGWLWPLWRMLGLTGAECDEELAGGRVDGDEADPRLAWLLDVAGGEEA